MKSSQTKKRTGLDLVQVVQNRVNYSLFKCKQVRAIIWLWKGTREMMLKTMIAWLSNCFYLAQLKCLIYMKYEVCLRFTAWTFCSVEPNELFSSDLKSEMNRLEIIFIKVAETAKILQVRKMKKSKNILFISSKCDEIFNTLFVTNKIDHFLG